MPHSPQVTTHAINLASSVDRRERVQARAAEVGLTARIFPALTGADLATRHASPELSPGEIGCFLSHRALLHEIAQDDADAVHLVLEDDVTFADGFRPALERILAERPPAMGMVQLGWLQYADDYARLVRVADRIRDSRVVRPLLRSRAVVLRTTFGWGSHCYLVTPVGAEYACRLLDFDETIRAPYDAYLRSVSLLSSPGFAWRSKRPLASPDPALPSTIWSRAP